MTNAEEILITKVREYYPDFQVTDGSTILSVTALTFEFIIRPAQPEATEIDRFFSMVNSLDIGTNKELLSLVVVSILEILTDTKLSQTIAFNHLKGDALAAFDELFEHQYNKLV